MGIEIVFKIAGIGILIAIICQLLKQTGRDDMAMLAALALTTTVLEVPAIAAAFGFTPVDWNEYAVALGLAILVVPIVELVKLFQRRAGK